MLLATSAKNGRCDVAPKGDPAGFVRVLDDKHLVIPDRPGNKRFDGLRNILENPHIGLIFLVPGRQEMLRVNGRAWITRDEELLDSMLVRGKRPWFATWTPSRPAPSYCEPARRSTSPWKRSPLAWPRACARVSTDRVSRQCRSRRGDPRGT